MKILYAIQGTGNGHVSRAREIIPHLQSHGELDILISGTQVDVPLNHPIKYRKKGMGFVFGKNGGVDYWLTYKHLDSSAFLKEVLSFPLKEYDLVLNDFEPIIAWAAHLRKHPIVSLSHQCSFLSSQVPRPELREKFGEFVLKNYAPCAKNIGFHFRQYDDFIHTPIIRSQIRHARPVNKGHYTVYLPACSDELIISSLGKIKNVQWEIFSKHSRTAYTSGNFRVIPVNNELYSQSLISCEGLLTGGGFESPAEALFLGKKLMVIPMKGQYEQQCNAAALAEIGVPLLVSLEPESRERIETWVHLGKPVAVNYPDKTAEIVADLVVAKRT